MGRFVEPGTPCLETRTVDGDIFLHECRMESGHRGAHRCFWSRSDGNDCDVTWKRRKRGGKGKQG